MNISRSSRLWVPLLAIVMGGCASMQTMISSPQVRLQNISVDTLDFTAQTFVLTFDVSNPNAFPLPISRVSYGVQLDGQHFAGGETDGSFSVPARGDGEFAITVELDLLRTAPKLLYIVRDGVNRDIPYELNGEFGVDIPFARPVAFRSSGQIRLNANGF